MSNPNVFNKLKVALVYDHLTTPFGGAELVLQTLHELFPDAPLFTSVYDLPKHNWANGMEIKTSFLQRIPLLRKYHQLLALFHPIAFESHDFSNYDVILSVSNGPAKGVITLPHQLHVCYLLTPTRYLSSNETESKKYLQSQPLFSVPGISWIAQPFLKYLKRWDAVAAWRPDFMIAISNLVAERSEAMYKRKVDTIIYPPFKPVVPSNIKLAGQEFFLCLTRLTNYKRIDSAVAAALETRTMLVIAGEGVCKKSLINQAGLAAYTRRDQETLSNCFTNAHSTGKTILFVGQCSEAEKQALLSQCQALVMPGEEDFGLVGLEAASAGKPTITYYKSGIAEVLKGKKLAIHLKAHSATELAEALRTFAATNFSSSDLKNTVQELQIEWFKELFHKTIYHFWQQHSTI